MKVKTASTRRAIDGWRHKSRAQVKRSRDWTFYHAARLLASPRRERAALVPLLVYASTFSFATMELVILVLLGFYVAKLKCYRFVNSLLGALQAHP